MARFDLVGEVRRSHQEETGEKVSRGTASVIVDRMCHAFVEIAAGVGTEEAVRRMPETARHLMWRWTGKEGKALRDAIAKVEAGSLVVAEAEAVLDGAS